MRDERVSEIAALEIKTLPDSVTKIAPDAYSTVRSEEIVYMARIIKELEAENARLRQQRDAANAQLDFILENLKTQQAD